MGTFFILQVKFIRRNICSNHYRICGIKSATIKISNKLNSKCNLDVLTV